MSDYYAPIQDIQFVIEEIAELDKVAQLSGYEEATPDLVEAILEQAGVFANEVFGPLNHGGDQHGTYVEDGIVVSPPGYAEAYRQFTENGWQGLGKSVDYGDCGNRSLSQVNASRGFSGESFG